MRYLILSDIHANWEALQAVLDAAAGAYDQVFCCGDVVGYGADANAVAEWVRANVTAVVRGNHDKAAAGLEDLEWFNPVARAAAVWTQRELTAENHAFIRSLPKGPLPVEAFQLVHGSPLDEDEYLFETGDAGPVFAYLDCALTFFGHTHVQGGFLRHRTRAETLRGPSLDSGRIALELRPDEVYMINPGSVGQPRDGDPRAGYILFDPQEHCVWYLRTPYDIATAQAKIRRAGLPDILAQRLAVGK